MIGMPGFVDTHWHLWTALAAVRSFRIDDQTRLSARDQPARSVLHTGRTFTAAVRLGLAEGLSAGATTVHNWAHNIRSPAHADAELRANARLGLVVSRLWDAEGLSQRAGHGLDGLAEIKREWMPNDGRSRWAFPHATSPTPQSPARQDLGRDRAQGLGWRTRAGTADHHAPPLGRVRSRSWSVSGLLGPTCKLVHRCLPPRRSARCSVSVARATALRRPASRGVSRAGVIQLAELLQAGVQGQHFDRSSGSYGRCDTSVQRID